MAYYVPLIAPQLFWTHEIYIDLFGPLLFRAFDGVGKGETGDFSSTKVLGLLFFVFAACTNSDTGFFWIFGLNCWGEGDRPFVFYSEDRRGEAKSSDAD